jgi:hypothetical protein
MLSTTMLNWSLFWRSESQCPYHVSLFRQNVTLITNLSFLWKLVQEPIETHTTFLPSTASVTACETDINDWLKSRKALRDAAKALKVDSENLKGRNVSSLLSTT